MALYCAYAFGPSRISQTTKPIKVTWTSFWVGFKMVPSSRVAMMSGQGRRSRSDRKLHASQARRRVHIVQFTIHALRSRTGSNVPVNGRQPRHTTGTPQYSLISSITSSWL